MPWMRSPILPQLACHQVIATTGQASQLFFKHALQRMNVVRNNCMHHVLVCTCIRWSASFLAAGHDVGSLEPLFMMGVWGTKDVFSLPYVSVGSTTPFNVILTPQRMDGLMLMYSIQVHPYPQKHHPSQYPLGCCAGLPPVHM